MTPDVDAIRQALTADRLANRAAFLENAPVWLAQAISEIEALRAEVARLKAER